MGLAEAATDALAPIYHPYHATRAMYFSFLRLMASSHDRQLTFTGYLFFDARLP